MANILVGAPWKAAEGRPTACDTQSRLGLAFFCGLPLHFFFVNDRGMVAGQYFETSVYS
jgi:hypothetical protein